MILAGRKILEECGRKHPDVRDQLSTLQRDLEEARWEMPLDIVGGDWLGKNNVVVFRIKGGHYRVVARVYFQKGIVRIRFAGTHAEYDKIDATRV